MSSSVDVSAKLAQATIAILMKQAGGDLKDTNSVLMLPPLMMLETTEAVELLRGAPKPAICVPFECHGRLALVTYQGIVERNATWSVDSGIGSGDIRQDATFQFEGPHDEFVRLSTDEVLEWHRQYQFPLSSIIIEKTNSRSGAEFLVRVVGDSGWQPDAVGTILNG